METIKISEQQLRALIKESVEESMMEEGVFDNLRAAWDGAKKGYKAQQTLDKDTVGLKSHHDYEDLQKQANPFGPGMERTAAEEANYIYSQYKEYASMANKLLTKYRQLVKEYGLQYTGKERDSKSKRLGKRENPGVKEPTKNPYFKSHGAPNKRKSAYEIGGKQDPQIKLR